jgi:glucans biosynthesis protein
MKARRRFLALAALWLAAGGLRAAPAAARQRSMRLGSPEPYSFEALVDKARALAARAYEPAPAVAPEVLERIDYDAHGKIRFNPDFALFADGPGRYPVTFFHLGRHFRQPVRMFVAENGAARELLYEAAYFDMPPDSPARELPADSGFAGFRFQESRLGGPGQPDWRKNDWVAFLGASYFRAIGELYQYGLSARGVAVNTAVTGRAEEFPAYTRMYFETPAGDADAVTVCALLDGPSLSGAYRFVLHRGKGVVMEVETALFLRQDVDRLGLAPLTSMYWFSETIKPAAVDWRPEVHDSDGLAIWTGAGEHIWRPLRNPARIAASAFVDTDPRGFGLLQRDRNFDHYLDGVYYDRRPSLWVEPLEGWGAGAVQLVEIPTNDEINDNVVAMWVAREPARAGTQRRLRYRLYWGADEPFPTALARCVATRMGRGGHAGQPRPAGVVKFVVEFLGGPLAALPFGTKPEAVPGASRGTLANIETEAVPDGVAGHWRAMFDLAAEPGEMVDLRLFLRLGQEALSETWLYQYEAGA